MAPGPFETHVYSLQSAFGVSRSHGQRSGADLREEILPSNSLQGCFALEGSTAAHHLRQRHRASSVPSIPGVASGWLSGIMQPQTEHSLTMLTPDNCSTRGSTYHMSVDVCDGTMVAPSYMGLDGYQYSRDVYSSHAKYRYCVLLTPVLNTILTLSLLVSQVDGSDIPYSTLSLPTTPSSIDTQFAATPSTSYFSQPSPAIESTLPLPSTGFLRSDSRGVSGLGLDVHSMPPPFSPVPPLEHVSQSDDDMFVSEDASRPCQKPRVPRITSLLSILRNLQKHKFTVLDLLSCIIDGYGEFEGFQNALFSPRNRDALLHLFDKLYCDTKGHTILSDWMFPHSITLVQEKIHAKMEAAKPCLRMHTSEVTPAFIEGWDIHRIMDPVMHDITPTLTCIIESAGESKASRAKTKSTKSKNRATVST